VVSKNVMEIFDFTDCIFYQVGCGCGNKDCNMTLELENCDSNMYLNMSKDLAFSVYWGEGNIFTRLWKRIKYASKLMFIGYIKVEESHVFNNSEQIEAFIEALNEGREKLLKYERISQNSNSLST